MINRIDLILNKIYRSLLNVHWLKKHSLDKDFIESFIKSDNFKHKIVYILCNNKFHSNDILFIIEPLMNSVISINPPENWLEYLYRFSLKKSFPNAIPYITPNEYIVALELYLKVMKIFNAEEKLASLPSYKSKYPLEFLSDSIIDSIEDKDEYKKFIKYFSEDYIYEMMKLSEDLYGFTTLDHICGVHYLSMFIANQLKAKGININLGRISGAAAGHDIGKYGCKSNELKRVPHLHYYYTDVWFSRHNINYIRNIAINHSTWDLEFENLSLESLILIYSDFRVKNKQTSEGFKMHIFSLEDSFNVILEKLENVDIAKEKRYKKVYSKLKDFEDYMINIAIEIDVDKKPSLKKDETNTFYSLLHGQEVINNIKYLSIDHNINLMYLLRNAHSLDIVLEKARSEQDWKKLREYINVLKEYSTYFTEAQKEQTMDFLYNLLIHPEDDIRRKSANLLGILIAYMDEDYRKEIPSHVVIMPDHKSIKFLEKYLNLMFKPKHKLINTHRKWLSYSTRIMINSLFKNCRKHMIKDYRSIIIEYFKGTNYDRETEVLLLETSKYIPMENIDDDLELVFEFMYSKLNKKAIELRISSLESLKRILPQLPKECSFKLKLFDYFENYSFVSPYAAENMLISEVCKKLGLKSPSIHYRDLYLNNTKAIQNIYLTNLKSATHWVVKKNQIETLVEYAINNPSENLYTALHFCNVLKVSEIESVRKRSGISILKLMPYLTTPKRNEVAVELLRALEIEGHRFTEYIPRYLGQVLLWLDPTELDEVIEDLRQKIKRSNSNLKTLILKTIGHLLLYYPQYGKRFTENTDKYNKRLATLIGILLNGLGDYSPKVNMAALGVIGKHVFGSHILSLQNKSYTFKLMSKKILTLLNAEKGNELLFLCTAAALNHIYRFISDYSFYIGKLNLNIPEKVAFFPGTFDPFSLGHTEIAKEIRDLGFEVYLAVDEFSWSKKTLPNLLRRKIINMSVASELDIYLYPSEIQINISNTENLKILKKCFSPIDVYMVAGSDVILNASSYKVAPSDNCIRSFPHVIFCRGKHSKSLEDAIKNICGEVKLLTLSSNYENISSSQIRNYIDQNRDISNLIDPLAESYIYEKGFYQSQPLDKSSLSSLSIDVFIHDSINCELVDEIYSILPKNKDKTQTFLDSLKSKSYSKLLLLRNKKNNELLGFSSFFWIRSNYLFEELSDEKLCHFIRNNAKGRVILINGLFVKSQYKNHDLEQILLTETLAFSIAKDYDYCLIKPEDALLYSPRFKELCLLQGFFEISTSSEYSSTLAVDMSNPCTLDMNIENIIKEPYRSNPNVKRVIEDCRLSLHRALCKIYPNQLLLSFHNEFMSQKLINLACEENNVPTEVTIPRALGNSMCVSYGDILDGYTVPNTVTKSLHIEKYFNPDMNGFNIFEFPYYLSMRDQVKMIKSFNRDVILVDSLLHKSYRMKALDPLLKEENLCIKNIVVGILSGRGKDIMAKQNRTVKCAYFIPRLKFWFNESDFYPFIGGNGIWRGEMATRNLIPSINLILPYTYPMFLKGIEPSKILELSKICMDNAKQILEVLEEEYYKNNCKNLTLANLGQILTVPRIPDHGMGLHYDLSQSPTYYINNDIEQLKRLEFMIKGRD